MTEKEKKIFETFADLIPKLPESGQDYFLAFAEGVETMLKVQATVKEPAAEGA